MNRRHHTFTINSTQTACFNINKIDEWKSAPFSNLRSPSSSYMNCSSMAWRRGISMSATTILKSSRDMRHETKYDCACVHGIVSRSCARTITSACAFCRLNAHRSCSVRVFHCQVPQLSRECPLLYLTQDSLLSVKVDCTYYYYN